MTWPLATAIDRAVPFPGDPYINTWILDWDWYATFHRPLSLFHANIFFPARYALAFSEHLYGIAVFLFPLRALGVPPLCAYNFTVLLGFAFSGWAAYLLGRHITQSTVAGLAAGVFYAFVPFRFTHLAHVQHVWGGWLLMLLLALVQHAQKRTWRSAIFVGIAFFLNGLSSIHALLFGSVALAVTLLVLRLSALRVVACTSLAILLMAPFLYPYYAASREYGMERHWDETMSFSARPADWLTSNSYNRLYGRLNDHAVDPERHLFPGVLALLVATFGVVAAIRGSPAVRPHLVVGVSWVVLGFLGSLGLHTFLHSFLFEYVPGFRAIRVPARWAMITYVGLTLLIALGTAAAAVRSTWGGAAIAVAFVLELWSAPVLLYMAIPQPPPVYEWIAHVKPRAIIELPLGPPGDETLYMVRATEHHRPIVNGWSGFGPPEYDKISALSHQEPISDVFLHELQRIGCTHIVVHANAITRPQRDWIRREVLQGHLGYLRHFDAGIFGDWVFMIGQHSAVPAELEAFFQGKPVYSETTFGAMFQPAPATSITTPATFSGFAFSPYGIRRVDLIFNSGRLREHTTMRSDPALQRAFPWYDATTQPVFERTFHHWPPGVWKTTDVHAEILDGAGRTIVLEDRFITTN